MIPIMTKIHICSDRGMDLATVTAETYGDLIAVHPRGWWSQPSHSKWALTHVPTGLHVAGRATPNGAHLLARGLVERFLPQLLGLRVELAEGRAGPTLAALAKFIGEIEVPEEDDLRICNE